jgi:hypothetical protein
MIAFRTTKRSPQETETTSETGSAGGEGTLLTVDHLNKINGFSYHTWAILLFLSYLIIGLLYNTYARNPPLNVLDSIYFSFMTLFIGYGK